MSTASFITNVNNLADNLDVIQASAELFNNQEVLDTLNQIKDLDIALVAKDLAKGNYLGNRKLDISFFKQLPEEVQAAINAEILSAAQENRVADISLIPGQISYKALRIVCNNGVIVDYDFPSVSGDAGTTNETSSIADLKDFLVDAIETHNMEYPPELIDASVAEFTNNTGSVLSGASLASAIVSIGLSGTTLPYTITLLDANSPVLVFTPTSTALTFDKPLTMTLGNLSFLPTSGVKGVKFFTLDSADTLITLGLNETLKFNFGGLELPNPKAIVNTEVRVVNESTTGVICQITDVDGRASNIDRIELFTVGNDLVEFAWADTTSALQTLANRVADILALGTHIDKIIELSFQTDEITYLYERKEELFDDPDSIYNRRVELEAIYNQLIAIKTVYDDIKVGGTNDINTVAEPVYKAKLETLHTELTKLLRLWDSITNIDRVHASIDKLDRVYTSISNLDNVHTSIANVDNVGSNITAVVNVSNNMSDIETLVNPTNLDAITTLAVPSNLAALQAASTNAANSLSSANAAEVSKNQAAISAASALNSANTATARANEIKAVTAQATTLIPGSAATVSYNSVDGKFTFGIPQGLKGDRGEAFQVNAVGTLSSRTLYDNQITGFSFLAIDQATIYFKLSATVGDWSVGAPFGKGETGATGATGNGIVSIDFLSTTDVSDTAGQSGATDTYRITMSDATTSDFIVYNGLDVALVDNLLSNSTVEALTANQGRVLKEELDTAVTSLTNNVNASLDTMNLSLSTTVDTLTNRVDNVVSEIDTALSSKANTTHSHTISDVTNLQTSLDSKAHVTHTHAITDVTDLQTTLNGKASLTGTETLTNKLVSGRFKDVTTVNDAATGTVTLDLGVSGVFNLTLSGNITVAVSNTPAVSGETFAFVVRITQPTTAYTVTWFSNITWLATNGTAPEAPAASKAVEYIFTTVDGTNWIGRKGASN